MTLHPDDLLFFNEVSSAMRIVARNYGLPLKSIDFLPMPASGMADRLGQCSPSGHIGLVLRCTVDGVWCDAPLSPNEVWDTAAHELAHLCHFNHGTSFEAFRMELLTAITNLRTDTTESHRDKILGKLVKMQAQRDGEAQLGNSEAAEAFASAINRMMIEHELHPSDVDYARTADRDPVIQVPWNPTVKKVRSRIAWQESLARVVAHAHLCKFLIQTGTNNIWFVGTKAHATVAEYTFGVLVAAAAKMSHKAYCDYWWDLRAQVGPAPAKQQGGRGLGFKESWLNAFIERISERMQEARRQAVVMATDAPGGTSTALIRLDGALAKAQAYIDDRFASKKRVSALSNHVRVNNSAGASHGRATADRMVIGRKGIEGAAASKALKGR